MSYRNYFRYDRDETAETRVFVYFYRPEAIYELDRTQNMDRSAELYIRDLETLIADLKEYRLDLAKRYSELAAMPYTSKLYLVREKSWSTKKVSYIVRLAHVFPDGKELNVRQDIFPGADRRKAFDLFEKLKKERPGIETVQDTEKKQWEK